MGTETADDFLRGVKYATGALLVLTTTIVSGMVAYSGFLIYQVHRDLLGFLLILGIALAIFGVPLSFVVIGRALRRRSE